jgi:hypothetical protein
VGVSLGLVLIASFGVSLVLLHIFPVGTDTLWYASVLLALLGVTMIISTMKKYVWGMVGSVFTVWLIYVVVVTPLIAEGPNLKTKIAEANVLGRPYGFLNIDDAKLRFYLDKPNQVFDDETCAFDWAIRTNGILVTSSDVSNQSWECIVKDRKWQAVIPRINFPLNDSNTFR